MSRRFKIYVVVVGAMNTVLIPLIFYLVVSHRSPALVLMLQVVVFLSALPGAILGFMKYGIRREPVERWVFPWDRDQPKRNEQ